jgi:hypothetical protein
MPEPTRPSDRRRGRPHNGEMRSSSWGQSGVGFRHTRGRPPSRRPEHVPVRPTHTGAAESPRECAPGHAPASLISLQVRAGLRCPGCQRPTALHGCPRGSKRGGPLRRARVALRGRVAVTGGVHWPAPLLAGVSPPRMIARTPALSASLRPGQARTTSTSSWAMAPASTAIAETWASPGPTAAPGATQDGPP